MQKLIEVIKSGKEYTVKLERDKVNGMIGISITVFCGKEKVMFHFLDFSKHPVKKIEKNIKKFSDNFGETEASEWVDMFLSGKR